MPKIYYKVVKREPVLAKLKSCARGNVTYKIGQWVKAPLRYYNGEHVKTKLFIFKNLANTKYFARNHLSTWEIYECFAKDVCKL